MQAKTLNLRHNTEQHENIAVRLLFPRTERSSNAHRNRLIQSTAGITQVNSVSGWISAGLGQWARHKGGIEIWSAVLIYSLPVLSLYSWHQHAPPGCTNLHLPWPSWEHRLKGPNRRKASERVAERSL